MYRVDVVVGGWNMGSEMGRSGAAARLLLHGLGMSSVSLYCHRFSSWGDYVTAQYSTTSSTTSRAFGRRGWSGWRAGQ